VGQSDTEDPIHIYDWNEAQTWSPGTPVVQLLDETLRDGLQSPSIVDPPIEDKRQLLRLMDQLGIECADLGLPGAGDRMVDHVTALCETIRDEGLAIRAACAGRTLASDVEPIIRIHRETGVVIEVLTFLGASPIRAYAEGWSVTRMRRLTVDAVRLGVRAGLPVAFVTEDTVRAHPEVLEELFRAAIDEGAERLILCDTVGHATPDGVTSLVDWTRELLVRIGAPTVGIDFHGHNDRGLALPNTLAAIAAGCDRVHGTALGIGERTGNAAMDQLLVNLSLLGWRSGDVSPLAAYCQRASQAVGRTIPQNYPIVGRDAFRTATGVHAAAIIKARKKRGEWLADRIYSGVPAELVGRRQLIEVGPLSGESNVIAWLDAQGCTANPVLVAEILRTAKGQRHTLRDAELWDIIHRTMGGHSPLNEA